MGRPRCIACGDSWGAVCPCRLTYEDDPEAWVEVYVCSACWESAERQHQARLRERERHLLAEWDGPREEQPA